jgi:DNA polymerase
VTTVVKVRPPENRTPRKGEIDAWRTVIEAELDAIDPDVVIPMGTTAARVVLGTSEEITDLHGTTAERDGRRVVPTFHPAATFYDASKRPDLAADLARAFDAAGNPVS